MRTPDRRPTVAERLLSDPDSAWGRGDDRTVDMRSGGGRELAVVPPEHWRELELAEQVAAAARARRAPYVIAAVTAAVGAAAWGVVRLVDVFAGRDAAGLVGALVWLGTWAAVPVLRATLRARIPARWARTWWLATCCAAAWVDAVVAAGAGALTPGAGLGLAAALLLGATLLGARWADEHEVPDPFHQDEPDPAPVPAAAPAARRVPALDTAEAEQVEHDWAARVAAGKSPIAPGSELDRREPLPHGWRWLVQLDQDESVSTTDLEADGASARVALKLGERATHVMLERLEDDPGEHLAMLTVVTRDVLADGVDYDGPRYDRGTIPIGRYADGTGEAVWRAFDPTGVLCGLITGGQGSGKSALAAAIGMGLRRSGEWIVLAGDGDEQGGSSHLLAEVAHDVARGPTEVLEQLQGLEAWGRIRGELMHTLTVGPDGRPTPITRPGQLPVAKIMPCPAFPGYAWILHEFYRLANDPYLQSVNFVDRVEAMVRILRKYGGCVIVETQSVLGDDFDGNSALRGMLAAGNRVALRNRNKSEDGIADDGLSPYTLPKGGGYAFIGEGDRRAMIRTARPDDMDCWAPQVTRYGRPDARSWAAFRRYRTVRELDAGADYQQRMAALAAFDDAIATGAPLPGSAEARGETDDDERPDEPLSVAGFAVPTLTGNVVPIRPELANPVEQAPPVDDRPLPDKPRRVLDALRSRPGAWRSAELAAATGLSASDVSKALGVLRGRDLAHRPTGVQGVHAAGPTEQEAM